MRLAILTTETLTDLKTDLVVANNNMFPWLKKHKHVFIYNRTEVMISLGNIANEFVACLQFLLDKSI